MGIIGIIKSWLPGNRIAQIELRGEDTATVVNFTAPGEDSQPMTGDAIVIIPAGDRGQQIVLASLDQTNKPKAVPGEKRIYSRKPNHDLAIELWLKADGDAVMTNGLGSFRMLADGSVNINGVVITKTGVVTLPNGVALNTHIHGGVTTGTGVTGVPV